ncbi:MAG: sigma-70 family RNA polymerase sigma factor [Candidatus Hydrogenedentes bacterium]|nr:sigma-70 family RNA polymerase sigma factor [Candidatus Hydrogenedentota bacterium]
MNRLEELVERSRGDDLDAFAELVRRFQDMAHGYAYSILGDFHLAQDAAQEAFIDAYYRLGALRDCAAFPGWFRRIVFKHCDRATRGKKVATVPLEEGLHVAQPRPERNELQDKVLEVVRELPERQREATTLYYINGYSQNEIAEFLEVPVTTVQKRLHNSRKRLKERMVDMLEETLKDNAPDERFSRRIIEELRSRPNLLALDGHPVKQMCDAIRKALPDYEWVEGDEVIEKEDPAGVYDVELLEAAYQVDTQIALRTSTTPTIMRAMAGRKVPMRLITAGRAFRAGRVGEHPLRDNVFHMVDVLCVDAGIGQQDLRRVLEGVVSSILGTAEIEWKQKETEFLGYVGSVEVAVRYNNAEVEIAGAGMLAPEVLVKAGFDPETMAGFGFGLGLDRMAMIKLGLNSIHMLRNAPYL